MYLFLNIMSYIFIGQLIYILNMARISDIPISITRNHRFYIQELNHTGDEDQISN
jgi:hypothetical protein